MKVLGFDCSSKRIDCVVLDEEGNFKTSLSLNSAIKDMDARALDLVRKLEKEIHRVLFIPCIAYIENAIYLNNVKATIGIASVIAMVKKVLHDNGVDFIGIDNRSWKKDVLGDGKAEKEKIMTFAKARWGDNIVSQDIADSAVIALYGVNKVCRNRA